MTMHTLPPLRKALPPLRKALPRKALPPLRKALPLLLIALGGAGLLPACASGSSTQPASGDWSASSDQHAPDRAERDRGSTHEVGRDATPDSGDGLVPDNSIGGSDLGGDPSGPTDSALTCASDCDDAIDCTEDRCEGGHCTHRPKAGFCLVEGSCYGAGERDGTSCQVCDPAQAADRFSDDASLCPADALSCTESACQQGQCKQLLSAERCLIGGICYGAGQLEPGADCRGCNPARSTSAFSKLSDGTPCTPDGLDCTADVCTDGVCENRLATTACLIAGSCYQSGDENLNAPCQHCDPSNSTATWTNRKDGTSCPADQLECTEDSCQRGVCTHPLKADRCLIGGSCFKGGQAKAGADCISCQPLVSTAAWQNAGDGAACTDDGVSCTSDACSGGTCKHPLNGNICLIDGRCYSADAPVDSAGCTVCMPSRSTSAATAMEGRICDDGDELTRGDTCLGTVCKGFRAYTYADETDRATEAKAFSAIEGQGLWVVGARVDSAGIDRGFLARVEGQNLTLSVSDTPLRGIHHRLAVGDSGRAFYHDGTSWTLAAGITSQLASADLSSVWGARFGTNHSFYLGGASIHKCTTSTNGSSFGCQLVSSPLSNLSAISGNAGASQGPLWATGGSSIAHSTAGASFDLSLPAACDGTLPTSACAGLPALSGLWAHSGSEAWAVGSTGTVLRYEGGAWSSLAIPNLEPEAPQSSYTFRGVFGSGELVILVGEREFANLYHQLVVIYYNRTLDRWFPPRVAFMTASTDPHRAAFRLNAGGSALPTAPYFGGSIWDTTFGTKRALFIVPSP